MGLDIGKRTGGGVLDGLIDGLIVSLLGYTIVLR